MSAPPDQGREGASAEYEELAELVRDAARGLDARDQLVLELSLRQGLQGADLADALGVSAQQSYGLVHRMRDRTERSLGALCVARAGRKECPELDEILRAWNGQFSVLIRKRVARHIDDCETCARTKRRFAPLVLLGSAKAMAAPIDLRDRVLSRTTIATGDTPPYAFTRPGGFPTVARRARRLAAVLGLAVIAVLVLGGTAAFVIAEGDQPDVIATADGAPAAAGADVLAAADPALGGPGDTMEQVAPGTGSITTVTDGEIVTTASVTTASVTTTSGPDGSTTTTQVASAAVVPPIPSDPPASSDAPSPLPPTEPTTTDATPATTQPTTTSPPTTSPPTTSPPTTKPPAPGTLTLDATTVDLGASERSRTVTLSNQGGQPVSFVVTVGSPFSLTAPGSVLAAGQSMALTISVDRSPPTPEGQFGATATLVPVEAGVATASMNLLATVERPPVVVVDGPPSAGYCPRQNPIPVSVRAVVTDEAPKLSVVFHATEPNGKRFEAPMSQDGDRWYGSLQLPAIGGGWQWSVVATDARGNVGSDGGKFAVDARYC
jgi:hypothetical protein